MGIAYRPAEPADRRFIVSTWAMSYQEADSAGMIAIEDWHKVMRPQINKVIDRPDARTIVAYETTDDGHEANLYGFITGEPDAKWPLVVYVYVKHAYRRAGVARGLFAALGVDPTRPFEYACRTRAVAEIYEARKIPCAQWDPMSVRQPRKRDR